MVDSTMSREHPERQTANPADNPAPALSIPRWAVIATALIVLLPILIMASMMLMMGWVGLPMHGGMAGSGQGLFPVVGGIPLLLVLGAMYGVYRLYAADPQ